MKVAFFAETADGKITRGAWELLAWSRTLAAPEKTAAVIVTPSIEEAQLQKLVSSGARHVFLCESPALDRADIPACAAILQSFCETYRPDVLLGAASVFGRALFPYAAMRMKTGLTADCTDLETDRQTGLLLQTRPAIGGNVMAVIKTPSHKPQMATVRPRSAPELPPYGGEPGSITRFPAPDSQSLPGAPRVTASIRLTHGEEIADARRIVAVGKGIKREGNIDLARRLASRLGAALGATREVVDRGWLPYSAQIGLSGKTVVPELYIALGISGAVQHLAGMRTARKIVAVNTDPDAPIFQVADLGIVGDLFEVVPRLIDEFSPKTK